MAEEFETPADPVTDKAPTQEDLIVKEEFETLSKWIEKHDYALDHGDFLPVKNVREFEKGEIKTDGGSNYYDGDPDFPEEDQYE